MNLQWKPSTSPKRFKKDHVEALENKNKEIARLKEKHKDELDLKETSLAAEQNRVMFQNSEIHRLKAEHQERIIALQSEHETEKTEAYNTGYRDAQRIFRKKLEEIIVILKGVDHKSCVMLIEEYLTEYLKEAKKHEI